MEAEMNALNIAEVEECKATVAETTGLDEDQVRSGCLDISKLRPELTRRCDEIFFVDLLIPGNERRSSGREKRPTNPR
jgi:hypothetical protein